MFVTRESSLRFLAIAMAVMGMAIVQTASAQCPAWKTGIYYSEGDVVRYTDGKDYKALHATSSANPSVSTWYWAPTGRCSTPPQTGFPITEAQFNELFKNRDKFYTYQGLRAAAKQFPAFTTEGSQEARKREIAAALANFSVETGGFLYIEESAKTSGDYCRDDRVSADCKCKPNKKYYGRGPIQLSWNANYCAAGKALGVDLLGSPELVATDSTIAWKTAIWFWMTNRGAGTHTPHDAMVNGPGFGETIRAINGSLECDGKKSGESRRTIKYKEITTKLDVLPGEHLGC